MVKGVSIKFKSYAETVPQLLKLIKLDVELKKHTSIVLKPGMDNGGENASNVMFTEAVAKYCIENKAPGSEVFIAEGCDGVDTLEVFEEKGYKSIAEKYGIGLVDLNKVECEQIFSSDFMALPSVYYPILLKDSFVISLPKLSKSVSYDFVGSLSNMMGTYPLKHYKGLFSKRKNKLDAHSSKYLIHDSIICKMPNLGLIDASDQGAILAGKPIEIDKQAAKLLDIDHRTVSYLKIIEERLAQMEKEAALSTPQKQ